MTAFEERFWAHVKIGEADECWEWQGYTQNGYGMVSKRLDGETRRAGAHRVAYTLWHGPIPDGLVVDHICFNTKCVNPAHLQLLTRVENMHRLSPAAIERRIARLYPGEFYERLRVDNLRRYHAA